MVFGSALEGLQAFTPDRSSNLMAAIYGAGGALAAALIAELFIRIFSNKEGKMAQGKALIAIRTRRLS
jgi:VanZ family protein